MAGTRTLAQPLTHTRAAAGALILVGDTAQPPEVGAGGLFTDLVANKC